MALLGGNSRAARGKTSVRRLFVRDPYNKNSTASQATFSPEAEQFTNNPNPLYDPSKAPGSVRELSVATARKSANRPGKASRGHAKVIRYSNFMRTAGKRLKRF
jgi:hypothetical protein